MSKTYYTGFYPDSDAAGSKGSAAFRQYTADLTLYIRSLTEPLQPSNGTYNFETSLLTPPEGWSVNIPEGTDPVWVSYARLTTYDRKEVVTTITWSAPVELFRSVDAPISIRITNPTSIIPSDSNGDNQVVSNSGTDIYVFEGQTQLAYDAIGTSPGTWTISNRTPINVSMGTILADFDDFARVNNIVSMTDDNGSVTYTITGLSTGGKSFSIETLQDFTRLKGSVVDTTPPSAPTGLTLSSSVITLDGGSTTSRLTAEWTSNTESDMSLYEVSIKEGAAGSYIAYQTTGTSYQWSVKTNQAYTVKLRAIDKSDNRSPYSAEVSHTTLKDTTAPAAPTGLTIASAIRTAFLTWTNPTASDLYTVEVWRNTTNNSSTATRITTVNAESGKPGSFTHSGLATGTTYYYWLKAVDTSGNVSGFNTGTSAGTSVTPGQTLYEDLAANSVRLSTIQDGAISVTKFASGLEPVTVVSSVPTVKSTTSIVNTTDGKLYRWNGTQYISSVPAVDVTGQLTNSQLEDIAASKIAGQITSTQIADNAITTAKLSAGSITAAKIAANSITANEIAAATITATQLSAGAVTTAKLAAGAVTANEIAADAITTAKIAAGAITADEIAAGAITAVKIATDTITANEIAAGAITSTELGAGSVIAGKIAAGSITAAEISAGTITSDKISAGTIEGDRIKTTTSLPGTITVGATGVSIQTVQTNAALGAENPATRINSGATTIDPGKILISGTTTLTSWRNGTDATKIEGGSIAANTISANKLNIGSRGIDISGLEFQASVDSSGVPTNSVTWTAGNIIYTNDAGTVVSVAITAGSLSWTAGTTYVYWVKGGTLLSTTTSTATAYGADKIVLATYRGGVNLIVNYGRTIIDGSQITAGTITGDRIVANSITASKIDSRELSIKDASGNIILAAGSPLNYTNVAGGPPIDATAGATFGVNISGQITSATASTYIANAAIGAAQIGSLSLVGTNNFSVKSGTTGQRMEMDSRVIKIYDSSNVLRVQIGDLSL